MTVELNNFLIKKLGEFVYVKTISFDFFYHIYTVKPKRYKKYISTKSQPYKPGMANSTINIVLKQIQNWHKWTKTINFSQYLKNKWLKKRLLSGL